MTKTPPIRLCVDCREFTGTGNTGIARYLLNLLRPLAQSPAVNLTCCLTRRENLPATITPSPAIEELPAWPTPLVDQIALPRIAARRQADWFFSPYYKTPFYGSYRKIITVHDIMFLRLGYDPPGKRRLAALQLRLATRMADIVLVDSDFTAADLTDYIPGIHPKIRRIYPDLGEEWFTDDHTSTPGSDTNAHAPPYFLYIGNFKPHKNVELLIQSFANLIRNQPNIKHNLILAGTDTANTPRIQDLLARLSPDQRIRIESEVDEERLRDLYRNADWMINASSYEGFGYPVAEAFASGCPVICNRNTSLTELAADAILAIEYLSVDSIATTLQTAARMPLADRLEFINKGRQRAQIFRPGSAAMNFQATLAKELQHARNMTHPGPNHPCNETQTR